MAATPDGHKILGRELQVQRKVGSGGFGDVLLVARVRAEAKPRHGFTFPPQCVVKVMREGLCGRTELEQAQREVRVLKALTHPYIVRYLGSWVELTRGPHHSRFCIALQYCEGGDMTALIRRCTKLRRMLPADVVVRLMAQVFSALNYSHSRHLIHRDIKPGNVLLTQFGDGVVGDAVVGDYGLVRSLDATRDAVATRVGTPTYISPEIVAGEHYTVKTDIFSAGTMFYELMCLSRPFWRSGISEHQLFSAVLNYDPMPRFLRLVGNTYSPALVEVLALCLSKHESKRASAYDVLVRLTSPVSAYVRSNAIPVYVEKEAVAPPAARASPPTPLVPSERADSQPPPTVVVAAPPTADAAGAPTVKERLSALFLQQPADSVAGRLERMLSSDPRLVVQIRVAVALAGGDDEAALLRDVRNVCRLRGYRASSPQMEAVTAFVEQHFQALL